MVGVSTSVNLPLHYTVQKFSSGTGSPGWCRKKSRKTVVVWRSNMFKVCGGSLMMRDLLLSLVVKVVTFCMRRRRREMYSDHARLSVCLCVCLSAAASPHYCTDPDVTWGNGRGCPLVVQYWVDLQSVHGFLCCDNTVRTRNVSEYLLVLAL